MAARYPTDPPDWHESELRNRHREHADSAPPLGIAGRGYAESGWAEARYGHGGSASADFSAQGGHYSQSGSHAAGSTTARGAEPVTGLPYGYSSQGPRTARRAPKGYRRSDERVREVLCERLMQDDHIDSSDVEVRVSDGKVLLEGTVPERYMKHAIEDMADACPGVAEIENRIRVKRPGIET